MAKQVDLLQGTLDMLVLRTLIFGPLHGYGIARAIRDASREALEIEFGIEGEIGENGSIGLTGSERTSLGACCDRGARQRERDEQKDGDSYAARHEASRSEGNV